MFTWFTAPVYTGRKTVYGPCARSVNTAVYMGRERARVISLRISHAGLQREHNLTSSDLT